MFIFLNNRCLLWIFFYISSTFLYYFWFYSSGCYSIFPKRGLIYRIFLSRFQFLFYFTYICCSAFTFHFVYSCLQGRLMTYLGPWRFSKLDPYQITLSKVLITIQLTSRICLWLWVYVVFSQSQFKILFDADVQNW